MRSRKTSKFPPGFTLIELVVVIALLAILTFTAIPRFINLGQEANIAVINSLKGSLTTAVNLITSKVIIMGLHDNRGVGAKGTPIEFDGMSFTVYNQGVPREIWFDGFEQLIGGDIIYIGAGAGHLEAACPEHICVVDNLKASTVLEGKEGYGIFFFPKGTLLTSNGCFAYYVFQITPQGLLAYKEIGTVSEGC